MLMKTVTPTPATLAQLPHLLDAGQALSATFRGHLSNHLPMAQQALLELGASAQRLQAWTERYETVLEPRGCAQPARVDPARDLGRPGSDASWPGSRRSGLGRGQRGAVQPSVRDRRVAAQAGQ